MDASVSSSPGISIRYSSDKVSWSTWYNFSKSDEKSPDGFGIYESKIELPQNAYERYFELMRQWRKTRPIWGSDEHEFCEWLTRKEPDFFTKHMPFIGYVQVRIEKMSVRKTQNLKSLTVGYAWRVSGLGSIPDNQSRVRLNTGEKWFFEGARK